MWQRVIDVFWPSTCAQTHTVCAEANHIHHFSILELIGQFEHEYILFMFVTHVTIMCRPSNKGALFFVLFSHYLLIQMTDSMWGLSRRWGALCLSCRHISSTEALVVSCLAVGRRLTVQHRAISQQPTVNIVLQVGRCFSILFEFPHYFINSYVTFVLLMYIIKHCFLISWLNPGRSLCYSSPLYTVACTALTKYFYFTLLGWSHLKHNNGAETHTLDTYLQCGFKAVGAFK